MIRYAKNLFSAGVSLLSFMLMASVVPLEAQSTASVTPINYIHSSVGILQAGDGNFYAPSLPILASCYGDDTQLCSYIYQITQAGNVSTFYSFQPIPNSSSFVNKDGIEPTALIVGTDGNLYGACQAGGPGGAGTIFQIPLGGTNPVINVFASFGGTDPGSQPISLIQGADGNFYFTNGLGIYEVSLAGVVSTIYTFPFMSQLSPNGALSTSIVQGSDGNLYMPLTVAPQAVQGGGTQGAIAELNGGFLNILHTFAADGSEGDHPMGPLAEGPDGGFYGVTLYSGNARTNPGTAFEVFPSSAFINLHQFTNLVGNRNGTLIVGSDGNLYGATGEGGDTASANCQPVGCGTIYQMTPSGTFTTLHTFEGGVPDFTDPPVPPTVDGASPTAPLVQTTDGSFYGTSYGNPNSVAVVYKASLTPAIPPPVQLTFDPAEVIPGDPTTLTWQVLNAFSLTAQQCGATIVGNPAGAGTWTGPQLGRMANGFYSGSATITPTANGIFTYALTCGGNESGFVTLTARDNSLLQIYPQTLDSNPGTVSLAYNLPLSAIGGKEPYTWSVSAGALPLGITLDSNTGLLSGTPTQNGKYSFVVEVVDSSPAPLHNDRSFILTVNSGLNLNPYLPSAVLNTPYAETLITTGGLLPYTWQLTLGKLPTGLQLNTSTGVISGTPTVAGQYSFTISVSDSENPEATIPQTFNLSVAGTLMVNGPCLPNAQVGISYSTSLEATGGNPPYFWSLGANGPNSVPPGLSLASNGTFSGTPTQYTTPVGFNNFNVVVTDSSTPAQTAPATLSIAVYSTLQVTTTTLPNGTVGVLTDVPLAATGGIPPYVWTASALPNPNVGISVINGNVLGYLPVVAMTSVVTLNVKDSENTPASVTVYPQLVTLPLGLPTTTALTSSSTTAATGESVTLTATVTPLAGGTPSGQVIFYSGITSLGTALVGTTGKAALPTSFATIGTFGITAAYSGNGTYAASLSTPLTETIYAPSAVPLVLSLSPGSATADGASFTLTVSGANFAANAVVLWNGAVRETQGVSSTQLTATILASDILAEGSGLVTVSNPAPDLGTSAAQLFVVMSSTPVATISGASISDAVDGSGNHLLTLMGTDFVSGSIVEWNGSELATTYVSPWQITATLPAPDFGSATTLTVVNPAPGGTSTGFELP